MPLGTDVETVPRILYGANNDRHGDRDDGEDHCHLHATRQISKERSLQGSLPLTLSDRIPIETFENIIDWMESHALLAAALVSRVWHPRAVHNLYHTVRLQSRKDFDLLVHQLQTSPRIKQRLSTTRELCVHRDYPDLFHRDYRRACLEQGLDSLNLDVLPIVFANSLPALRVLDIAGFSHPPMHPTFYLALSHFKHVTSLRLHGIMLRNVTQLQQIVCALLGLKEVVLELLIPIHQFSGTRFRTLCETRLERLEVHADPADSDELITSIHPFDPIITWLVDSGVCSSLSELVISRVFRDDPYPGPYPRYRYCSNGLLAKQVNRLLETSGSSLTSFRGDQNEFRFRGKFPLPSSLVHNTTLSQLILYLYPRAGRKTRAWQLASQLHAILYTVRSHELRHIAIHLRGLSPENLKEHDLADTPALRNYHDVMEKPCFRALTDVHVKLEFTSRPHAHDLLCNDAHKLDYLAMLTKTIFRPMLLPWHDRGIVSIDSDYAG
ncbi:uncharacterized protein B0H18DRAFT_1123646 [Fomitopsis serialis]|uniref:uncharacterized protein n=1 Tax=Fomitopsis serialis TaxID=139415 RepID=UPI002007493E|nr:uncharacterized protein B0H18DRAFT_1123646 [Neoantrodia serialis]KAH9917294.1 hypothetical protein B0H18DRAFT_1123646 [Neoantrodia serialis]